MNTKLAVASVSALAFCVATGCAQAPDAELRVAGARVEEARSADATTFATEPLVAAESALARAHALSRDEDYLGAIHAAADAVSHADDAFDVAVLEKLRSERQLARCLLELEGLLEIARSRGAAEDELAGFDARFNAIRTAAGGDTLGALGQALELKPELLALEQRFRHEAP